MTPSDMALRENFTSSSELLPEVLPALLDSAAAAYPDHEAIREATGGAAISYRDLLHLSRQLRDHLRELGVKCAMDLSDGLSLDLARLCRASACAAALDDVPIVRGAALPHALHGGEDYELLFTLPKALPLPPKRHVIGRIEKGPAGQITFHNQPLPPLGWDHFQRT